MLISTGQIAKICSIPKSSIGNLVAKGFLKPHHVSMSEGEPNLYRLSQALAIGCLFNARRRGSTLEAALAAHDYLCSLSESDLQELFVQNRRYLVLIGQQISPRLVPRDIAFNPATFETALETGLNLTIVDVQEAATRIRQGLEAGRFDDAADTASTEPAAKPEDACPA